MSSALWMFHRVLPGAAQAFGLPSCYRLRGTAITPAEWERFLDSIPAPGSLGDDEPGVVLTFDDGYREWVDFVAPSLRRRGFTATFFACRAFRAEADKAHPVDRLYWLLDHAVRPELRAVVKGDRITLRIDTLEGKRAAISGPLKERIVVGPPEEIEAVLAQVAASLACELPEDLPVLLYPAEAEWHGLADEFDVGAHGLTHRRSTTLSDDELRDELDGSLRWIRALGGIEWWCHPDGDNDPRVRRLVRQAGFTDALGVESGGGRFDRPRRFATPAAISAHATSAGIRRAHVAHG